LDLQHIEAPTGEHWVVTIVAQASREIDDISWTHNQDRGVYRHMAIQPKVLPGDRLHVLSKLIESRTSQEKPIQVVVGIVTMNSRTSPR
tara:strand:+ start:378 stop:644 length:267 start_codon:yes stop_codon:yes gene_type:complete